MGCQKALDFNLLSSYSAISFKKSDIPKRRQRFFMRRKGFGRTKVRPGFKEPKKADLKKDNARSTVRLGSNKMIQVGSSLISKEIENKFIKIHKNRTFLNKIKESHNLFLGKKSFGVSKSSKVLASKDRETPNKKIKTDPKVSRGIAIKPKKELFSKFKLKHSSKNGL